MSEPLDVSCPTCKKGLKVPPEFAGKSIRCKNCKTAFRVPEIGGGPAPARPVAARPAGPVAARPAAPVAARPADPAAPIPFKDDPPPPPPKPTPFTDDEEETKPGQPANPYGVIRGDEDIPRCPFCAKELDPPDTRLCLNCGYDLLERKRHDARVVYELTIGDYLKHWLPAIACVLAVIALVTLNVICWLNMYSWLEGSFLDKEERHPITDAREYYIKPWCFSLWISIFSAWICFKAGKFAIQRLVFEWRPPEQRKATTATIR
jgi:hypothetical protein